MLKLVPLLFHGVKGSFLVLRPKGSKCKDEFGERVLFNLSDQTSNKCKYFEPFEIAWRGQETFELDKVY